MCKKLVICVKKCIFAAILKRLFMNVSWFSFPVGIAIGVALVAALYVMECEWGRRKWVIKMRSPRMSCWLIGLTVVACIIGGSLPYGTSSSYSSPFQTSIPFVTLLVALTAHLTLVIIHRIRTVNILKDWIFLATHVGLWLALFSGLVGAGDNKELRSIVGREKATTSAIDPNGRMASLPYSLRLKDFNITANPADGSPTQYSATVLIDDRPVEIAVNSPYSVGLSEDIYLMSFDAETNASYCVLMVERQPWKYPMLAGLSLLLLGAVAGGGKLRIKN